MKYKNMIYMKYEQWVHKHDRESIIHNPKTARASAPVLTSGLELIKDIKAIHPGLPTLVISMHDESLYAERVLRAGARGYITKHEGGEKLLQAIRQVLSGQIYVSEKMSAHILETFSRGQTAPARSLIARLSDREFEVFELLGEGVSAHEIARRLRM